MFSRFFILLAGGMLATSACVDTGKDSAESGETGTPDTDIDTFTVSGELDIQTATFSTSIGLWSLTGTSTSCSDCLYAFDGTFTLIKGSGEDFTRSVTIADTGNDDKGYDIGLVYAEGDMWGYAYDNAATGYTLVSNYSQYASGDFISYGYTGYWYR